MARRISFGGNPLIEETWLFRSRGAPQKRWLVYGLDVAAHTTNRRGSIALRLICFGCSHPDENVLWILSTDSDINQVPKPEQACPASTSYVWIRISCAVPQFAPGNNVSQGWSNLCQTNFSVSALFSPVTTKFPDSKSFTIGLRVAVDELDDHTTPLVRFMTSRLPWRVIRRRPEESRSGVSLLATQTIVIGDILLYHIPKYLFSELPGVKKPKANLPPDETMVSPSLMEKVVLMVSIAEDEMINTKNKEQQGKSSGNLFFISIVVQHLRQKGEELTDPREGGKERRAGWV